MSENQPLVQGDILAPDFLLKQGKATTNVEPIEYVTAAAIVILGIPIFVLLLLPIALITFIVKRFVLKPPQNTDNASTSSHQKFIKFDATNKIMPSQRTYDMVLYGATGFTGSIAVEYIVKHYLSSSNTSRHLTSSSDSNTTTTTSTQQPLRIAIAGRNKTALNNILEKALQSINLDTLISSIDVIIADSDNIESLRSMVNNTRVIISTAGPFAKYGSNLVGLCAAYGTHYCDITGESDWVRQVIDYYEIQAKNSGAIITHHCGHDCIPWELAVQQASNILSTTYNESVVNIEAYDQLGGSLSGGTLATLIHGLTDRKQVTTQLGYDPLLSHYGVRQSSELRMVPVAFPTFSKYAQGWVGPFVMSPVMANCIRRSNAILHYSKPGMIIFGVCLFIPYLPELFSKIQPPGSGPSPQSQQDGFLRIRIIAKGDKGTKIETGVYIPRDPGYLETATMLVESGLTLVSLYRKNALPSPGVWTPAISLGENLKERLENAEFVFKSRSLTTTTTTPQ